MDSRKLAAVTRGRSGPVFRRLVQDADLVVAKAKEEVGVHRPVDAYDAEHRKRRPGTLRDTIVKRVRDVGGVPVIEIGSEDDIALIHHEGTEPHIIRARQAPRLVFYWPKAGRVVAFKQVSHPGTKPNRFLLKGLEALSARYGGYGRGGVRSSVRVRRGSGAAGGRRR